MTLITIQSYKDNTTLFQGKFNDFKEALEYAAEQNINLSYADLSHQNLSQVNLDCTTLDCCNFNGSNLQGANLSESNLRHANFQNTDLVDCCFNSSTLSHCNFEGARFGASDVTNAILDDSIFRFDSCFMLNFKTVRSMKNCRYLHDDQSIAMTHPPVVVQGITRAPLVFLDRHILCERKIYNRNQAASPLFPKTIKK